MATAAIIGKGSTFSSSPTINGSYTAIAEVLDIEQPRIKVEMIDATNFDSPIGSDGAYYTEKVSGVWRDVDDIPVTLHYLKAQTTTIISYIGANRYYKVTMPDASTWIGPGVLCDYGSAKITPKGLIQQDFKIAATGAWIWAAGA